MLNVAGKRMQVINWVYSTARRRALENINDDEKFNSYTKIAKEAAASRFDRRA